MKTPLDAPPEQIRTETGVKQAPAPVIDTSKMSAGKAAALDLAESSRDPLDERGSFASNLFIGRYDFDRIFPFPTQSEEDRAKGEPFLNDLLNSHNPLSLSWAVQNQTGERVDPLLH